MSDQKTRFKFRVWNEGLEEMLDTSGVMAEVLPENKEELIDL